MSTVVVRSRAREVRSEHFHAVKGGLGWWVALSLDGTSGHGAVRGGVRDARQLLAEAESELARSREFASNRQVLKERT